ncbi:hypothetical protein L7F22_028562 [Adiantum nelumboides]|nr:hypothetical protein [Adiantum nelumboides]
MLVDRVLEPLNDALEAYEVRLKRKQTLEQQGRKYPHAKVETKRLKIFKDLVKTVQAMMNLEPPIPPLETKPKSVGFEIPKAKFVETSTQRNIELKSQKDVQAKTISQETNNLEIQLDDIAVANTIDEQRSQFMKPIPKIGETWPMNYGKLLENSWWNAVLAGTLLVLVCCCLISWRRRRRLPPGPGMGWPVIGHMHLLGALPHKSLHKLSQKYGPIVFLRLGSSPTVVLSSPTLAKQFLHDHDEAFAFRPAMESAKHIFFNHGSGLMQPDNPRWKAIRRLYVQEVLSPKSLLSSKHVRNREIGLLLQEVRNAAAADKPVELRALANGWTANVMASLLFSQRVSDGELSELPAMLKELAELFAQPLIGDFVPYLRWFDPRGLRRRTKLAAKRMDALLQHVLDKRLRQRRAVEAGAQDLLTAFLDFFGEAADDPADEYEYAPVKGAIVEILIASSDTTAATVEWGMRELLRAPKSKIGKLQEEIDAVVEGGQQVEESHLDSLPYLGAVVKETFRLHPPVPLLLPHLARNPIEIAGYCLPKNTRVFSNMWTIGRDESLWEAAQEFKPERFMPGGHASEVGLLGVQSYQPLMPFGRGRRGCPGSNLGIIMVSLFVANLVHSFGWESSMASSPDDEVVGMFNMLAQPFAAKPSNRHSF